MESNTVVDLKTVAGALAFDGEPVEEIARRLGTSGTRERVMQKRIREDDIIDIETAASAVLYFDGATVSVGKMIEWQDAGVKRNDGSFVRRADGSIVQLGGGMQGTERFTTAESLLRFVRETGRFLRPNTRGPIRLAKSSALEQAVDLSFWLEEQEGTGNLRDGYFEV